MENRIRVTGSKICSPQVVPLYAEMARRPQCAPLAGARVRRFGGTVGSSSTRVEGTHWEPRDPMPPPTMPPPCTKGPSLPAINPAAIENTTPINFATSVRTCPLPKTPQLPKSARSKLPCRPSPVIEIIIYGVTYLKLLPAHTPRQSRWSKRTHVLPFRAASSPARPDLFERASRSMLRGVILYFFF